MLSQRKQNHLELNSLPTIQVRSRDYHYQCAPEEPAPSAPCPLLTYGTVLTHGTSAAFHTYRYTMEHSES